MKNKKLAKLFVVFSSLALLLAACGGGSRPNRQTSTNSESTNQESTTSSTGSNSTTGQETYTLSSLQITKQPDKLSYFVGDTFDPTGMEVTAHFRPTKSEIIPNNDLAFDYDFSSTGSKTVTVSFTYTSVTKSTTLSVTVKQRPPEGSVQLDFYAFNDWHGNVLDTSLSVGISKTSTFLKQKTQNQNSLLISSGDMWQGTMESNSTRGKLMMEWMEYMNFTSMTIGNHEFDWGKEVIRQNAQNYNVPILGINIIDNNTHERVDYVTPSTVVERGGVKIGIIGAIGNCYGSISYSQVMDVSFVLDSQYSHPLTDLVKAESTRLRQQEGCDFIVYSFHGDSVHDDTYYNLELSSGGYVDVVLEGHKHIETYYQDDAGIWHFQSNADGTMAINHFSVNLNPTTDEFTLSFNESTDAYRMNSSDKYNLATDAGVEALINKYDFSAAYQTIGYNSYDRSGYEMRQKCADLYLEYGFAKWGPTLSQDPVLAGGYISIRGDGYLRQGNITYANLYSLFPFDNDIVLCQITGSTLQTVYFNTTNSNYFMSYTSYGNSLRDDPSLVVSNDLYYVICDTYSSDWMLKVGYNPIIVDRYATDGCYARDLFADYAQKGGFNEGGQQSNPWDGVPIIHSGVRTSPYTVSEAYALAKTSSVLESACVYIQGKISDLSQSAIQNGQYENIILVDIETGHQDLSLRVLALNRFCDATEEEGFKSLNDFAVGDELLIYGKVEISGGTPYLTDSTVAVLVNDLPIVGLSQDDPISVTSYLLFDDGRSNLYVKGVASDVSLDGNGNVTSFYLYGNYASVIAQLSPYGYYVFFNNNISVASGVNKALIKQGNTLVIKVLLNGVQIVDAIEPTPIVDGTYYTNSICYDSFLVGTTETTVNAYNSLADAKMITLTHSSMEIGIDREDGAYGNTCFKIQSNGYMCITAPAGFKVTQIVLRICYTYDNFDFYAGNEINESNRLEETRQTASASPWWLEYTVAADSNSVYIYNTYSGGVVNCYELRITIQAI